MIKLSRLFQRPGQAAPDGAEAMRSLFAKFRRILDMNTRVLERMATMEQALGGDYIFDQAFLDSSVREISAHVHKVVYSLNAMCEERYVDLYDRYQEIKGILEDILGGGLGPHASALVLPASAIRWDMEPLVGARPARLAELRNRLGLPVCDGFAVTVTGCAGLRRGGQARDEAIQALAREAEALDRRDGHGGLAVTVAPAGFDVSRFEEPTVAAETDVGGLAETLLQALDRAVPSPSSDIGASAWVCTAVQAALSGRVLGLSPGHPEALSVAVEPAGDALAREHYLLRRTYPFDLLRSDIRTKSTRHPLPDGNTPLTVLTATGLRRGSALLHPDQLRQLAEAALASERLFGMPLALDFVLDRRNRLVFLAADPLGAVAEHGPAPEDAPALATALARAEVLVRGGQAAQSGTAAGRAVHVDEGVAAGHFPTGAVAVARRASPRLAPILRRASAMVTEVGTPAGHLATIAREARIPALFGVPDALERIPEGTEVTVDAAGAVVYRGVVQPLLGPAASGSDLYPTDPEYVLLRRLLRFIQPLGLTDPQAGDFDPAHCSSYHDIIHFAHEQAVEELLHIQQRHKGIGTVRTRRLAMDVPLDLRVLDMAPGMDPESSFDGNPATGDMTPADVTSRPLRAFLRGLERKNMWSDRPVGLRLRDVFAGMDRTFTALTADPATSGGNLAITAPDYCNVSLRLGYHFSVLDAYLGANSNQNSLYFRFVGGLADATRRARRTALIRRILESLDFAVQSKGDLVTGRLRLVDGPDAVAALERLGALTAFTRQLDVAMSSDQDVDDLATRFMEAAEFQAGGGRP